MSEKLIIFILSCILVHTLWSYDTI